MERMVMRMRSFCEILSNGVIMRKRDCVEGTAVYRIESILFQERMKAIHVF